MDGMGKRKRRQNVEIETEIISYNALPEGCHHYYEISEVPWDIHK